jgi:dTDP-4-amino-4,6-dideoxygalactose transaminase
MTGSFGDAGCFSFYPSKNLGACGDGGLLLLREEAVAEEVRSLRNHGSSGAYLHGTVGINSRLDEVQAAILLVKLKHVKRCNEIRRQKAARYTALLKDMVSCPVEKDSYNHVYHQYTIRSPERDRIREKLAGEGVSSMVYYPVPAHLQPALEGMGFTEGSLPVSEMASREVLSLPMGPELEDKDIERIADIIRGV